MLKERKTRCDKHKPRDALGYTYRQRGGTSISCRRDDTICRWRITPASAAKNDPINRHKTTVSKVISKKLRATAPRSTALLLRHHLLRGIFQSARASVLHKCRKFDSTLTYSAKTVELAGAAVAATMLNESEQKGMREEWSKKQSI